ncbi:Glutathione transferase GST 23 [Cinnamomum micranthum f. kanehirae]|uniref:glutathione transferase n=1 Tax=Cinnamomum micranthum f. kanehirae TaxID=337451 RepID=A0A3S3NT55_9MAGN|nr:Glutathione transferase GST 23 [Cinnamomum micranthum f. kanehirae]
MGEVKVLGAFLSPYPCRVEWALLHKGIKYEYIDEDLKNKSPLLLKCNPIHKKVPVLLHGEKSIAESLIILEYIDETWKENPLLPQDPLERAKCFASIRTAVFRSEGKEQEKAVEEFLEALKTLEEELNGKEFFGGESVGFLDLVVGWITHWLPVFEEMCGFKLLNANTFPSLHAWGDRFLNVPFFKEKLPPSDELLVRLTDCAFSIWTAFRTEAKEQEKAVEASLEALKALDEEIPVLLHGGKPIAESLVILEYIDETWKENPLLPQDPYERAKARFWAKFAEEKCGFNIRTAFYSEGEEREKAVKSALEAMKTLDEELKGKEFFGGERVGFVDLVCGLTIRTAFYSAGEEREKALKSALVEMKILEEELKGKEFFGGERVGFLDLVVGWIPYFLPVLEEVGGFKLLDADAFPFLHAWSERFLNVPFIKEKLPPSDRVLAYVANLRKVEWALTYKGITYEYIEEDLHNKSPSLLKYNPVHKKIPVLLHGGKPIAESLVILEYIDETWKENPLLPQDPYERAKARFWVKFVEEKCGFNIRTAFNSKGEEREKAVKSALEAMKTLEEELKGKEFFGGEGVGFLDLVVGLIPYWLPVLEEVGGFKLLDADALPFLHAWGDRFLNIPFIKEKLPPSDRLLAYVANLQKR